MTGPELLERDPRPPWIPRAHPTSGWDLAGNLACRADAIDDAYPGITIYAIGDESHQNGQSDHNLDARDIVHAIDVMTYTDTARGNEILAWVLDDTTDIEYVIFDGYIYERGNGFDARSYSGAPHDDHVHVSGKHGNTGYSSATGTGYDTTAEAYRPEGLDGMAYSEAEMQAFTWQYAGRGMNGVPEGKSTLWVYGEIYSMLVAQKAQLTTLQESVDALELAAGTNPTGAHSHGDGAGHGAAPPA